MPNFHFTLVSLYSGNSSKSNKAFYKVTLVDNQGNSSNCFVDKVSFDKLKNYLFKDITQFVNLIYMSDISAYKLLIKI